MEETILERHKKNSIARWHDKNYKSWSVDNRQRIKIELIRWKGGICEICKKSFLSCCYDFHHSDIEKKVFKNNAIYLTSIKRAKKNLKNHQLLCSNCHRIVHTKRSL